MTISASAYLDAADAVVREFETIPTGLTTAVVAEHRLRVGPNVIVELAKASGIRRQLRQFADWLRVSPCPPMCA